MTWDGPGSIPADEQDNRAVVCCRCGGVHFTPSRRRGGALRCLRPRRVGIAARKLPRFVNLNGFPILPNDIRCNRFCHATVHQENRTLLRLGIIAGGDIQSRHSSILRGLKNWGVNQNIQCFTAGMVADQFECVIRGLFEQSIAACVQPGDDIGDLGDTGDLQYMALAQEYI